MLQMQYKTLLEGLIKQKTGQAMKQGTSGLSWHTNWEQVQRQQETLLQDHADFKCFKHLSFIVFL